jgi:hypothetical protein
MPHISGKGGYMDIFRMAAAAFIFNFVGIANAATYKVSWDGLAVVRLTSPQAISASSFDTSLLPSGYTSSTATGGALGIINFKADFYNGSGGGIITAVFSRSAALGPGQKLDWIQVGMDNDVHAGYYSPYFDSTPATTPFYAMTAYYNRNNSLPANKLIFGDGSTRPPSHLFTKVDPIIWNANLYPVIKDNNKNIKVFDGISWGWTMTKATVGTTSGEFNNPSPSTAITTGVGTNTFSWGSGDPGSLSFSGATFDTAPNTAFTLGQLTYHNGSISSGEASSVHFTTSIHFDNVPEKDFDFHTTFTIINTPNTGDPVADADVVSIGNFGYTFSVPEGGTSTVDLNAELLTNLTLSPGKLSTNAEVSEGPFDPDPIYSLKIIGLSNPTNGGFISPVPEPAPLILFLLGSIVIAIRTYRT